MKIHCLLRTAHYRGERVDPVSQAVTIKQGETVEKLAERLLSTAGTDWTKREVRPHDWIEIRVEAEGPEDTGGY